MREKPAAEIIQYILDLKKDSSVALHRTKLMVVGYEKVGKTSLLECLFPFTTTRPVIYNGQQVRLEIVKKDLIVHPTKPVTPLALSSQSIMFHLREGKWSVSSASPSSPAIIVLQCEPASKDEDGKVLKKLRQDVQLTIEDETEREEVVKRLKRICGDERTHGIDIQRQLIPIPSSDSQLEVSVWDFGGQHEYYNNHHYFLSARSVFLVVWKATEGVDDQLGVSGLEFWLNSLKAHLPPPPAGNEKPLYSIIVVCWDPY